MNSQYIEDEIEVTVESHDQDEKLRTRLTTQLNNLRRFINYNIEFLDDYNLILKASRVIETRIYANVYRLFTIDHKPYVVTKTGCTTLIYNEAKNILECISATDQEFKSRPGEHYESERICFDLQYEKCSHIDYYSDNEDEVVHYEYKDKLVYTRDLLSPTNIPLIRYDTYKYEYLNLYDSGVIFVIDNEIFMTGDRNHIYRFVR